MMNPCAEWFTDAGNDESLFKLICYVVGGKRTASRVAMDIEKTLSGTNLVSLQLPYVDDGVMERKQISVHQIVSGAMVVNCR